MTSCSALSCVLVPSPVPVARISPQRCSAHRDAQPMEVLSPWRSSAHRDAQAMEVLSPWRCSAHRDAQPMEELSPWRCSAQGCWEDWGGCALGCRVVWCSSMLRRLSGIRDKRWRGDMFSGSSCPLRSPTPGDLMKSTAAPTAWAEIQVRPSLWNTHRLAPCLESKAHRTKAKEKQTVGCWLLCPHIPQAASGRRGCSWGSWHTNRWGTP